MNNIEKLLNLIQDLNKVSSTENIMIVDKDEYELLQKEVELLKKKLELCNKLKISYKIKALGK